MGFVLTILYFVTAYLTSPVLFGPLAAYRIELILATLIFFVSLPKLAGSMVFNTAQSMALIGLLVATFMSVLVGEHWAGGAVTMFVGLLPSFLAYFLVCLHCNSQRRLKVVVIMLLFVCLFVIARGWIDLQYGIQGASAQISGLNLWDIEHPYLFSMTNDAGETFYRLRGLGLINDPNDFGQVVVSVIPLVFIFWRAKRMLRNFTFVLLPVGLLVYGVFLTHSRGALLALVSMAVLAGRRRIGTVPALVLASGLFVAAMTLGFTGGREISAESGSDRTALWDGSMQLLKSHPFFGVGAGNLENYLGLTAHNSVMVCAAELGLFGLYFWSLFLCCTVRDALEVASPEKVNEGDPIVAEEGRFPWETRKIEELDKAEINKMGRLLILSLTGFLVTGWFLSRAFVMTLYLLGGMVEVVYEMALQRGMVAPRLRLARLLRHAGVLAISLILVMYIMLRSVHLMH